MAIVDDHMRAYERELVLNNDPMFGMFKAARADLKQVATAIDALKRAAMPRITREQAIDAAVRKVFGGAKRRPRQTMKAIISRADEGWPMNIVFRTPNDGVNRMLPRVRAEFNRIMAAA